MNKILVIIFILIIIFLLTSKKKTIYENLEIEDSTTREWDDPNKECLEKNHKTCQENLNCVWNNHLNNCIKRGFVNSEIDVESVCDIYNNDYLDSNPYHKKESCQKVGCNFINLDDGRNKCVSNFYNNHLEYCQNTFDKVDCHKKTDCNWTDSNCLPNNLDSNIVCRNFNTPDFLLKNLCKKDTPKNNYNCFVEVKRDINDLIIPYTGFNEFKKKKCEEVGCKTVNISKSELNLCVSNKLKTEEDICLNYYNGENVSYSKCKEIGCNYFQDLNKEYNGLCYSKQVSDRNDNQISTTILCNSIKDTKICKNIGCTFADNKCKN
jgi:hypothetical protein